MVVDYDVGWYDTVEQPIVQSVTQGRNFGLNCGVAIQKENGAPLGLEAKGVEFPFT